MTIVFSTGRLLQRHDLPSIFALRHYLVHILKNLGSISTILDLAGTATAIFWTGQDLRRQMAENNFSHARLEPHQVWYVRNEY
jgi:hypothetical protein